MQQDVEEIIKNIKLKTQRLQAQHDALIKENIALKGKIETVVLREAEMHNEIFQLQQQIQALLLTQSNIDEEEKKKISKSIDKHIAAINKSITLLSD